MDLLDTWDLTRVKIVLKRRRKQLGLKQEDLVEPGVLTITNITHIETGKTHINEEKYLAYLEKVNWTIKELKEALQEEAKKQERFPPELALHFKMIESLIDADEEKSAFIELKNIFLPEGSPYLAMLNFLYGKYYNKKNKPETPQNWETAKRYFYDAIKECNSSTKMQQLNLKSAIFGELGKGYARKNNLNQAIKCVREGIGFYIPSGFRKDVIYTLLLCEAIFLEKLKKHGEANKVLEKLWEKEKEVNTEILLNMIELQANLYNKNQLYKESIKILKKGIEIARREYNFDRLFELWTTLGKTYKSMGQVSMLKMCLKTASKIENKTRNKMLRGDLYTEMGLLYLDEGQVEKSKKYLEKAIKLCKDGEDAPRYCESLLAMSDLSLYTNQKDEGIVYREKALKVANNHNLNKLQENIALKLAKITEGTLIHSKYKDLHYDLSVKNMESGDKMNSFIKMESAVADPPPT